MCFNGEMHYNWSNQNFFSKHLVFNNSTYLPKTGFLITLLIPVWELGFHQSYEK